MNGTAENEYMHESIEKDAVKYDLPSEEIIEALCRDNKQLQSENEKLVAQLESIKSRSIVKRQPLLLQDELAKHKETIKKLRKDNGEIAYDFAKENDKLQAEIDKRPATPLYGEARSRLLKAMNVANCDDAIEKFNKLQAENKQLQSDCLFGEDSQQLKTGVIAQLQAEVERLKKEITDVCDLINKKGAVSKWKILNWLEQILKKDRRQDAKEQRGKVKKQFEAKKNENRTD